MAALPFNLVKDALRLDDNQESLAALAKYTEATQALSVGLLEIFASNEPRRISADSIAKKHVALLSQCVGRINDLFQNLETENGENSASVDRVPQRRIYSRSESSEAQSSSSFSKNDPMTSAMEQNRQLLCRHVEQLKKSNMTSAQLATLNMSLQRKLTENLEIARDKKRHIEIEKQKRRQAALESLDKNRKTANLSNDEKQFIADVQEFEANNTELRLMSLHLNEKGGKRTEDYATVLNHYVDSILSNPDHPFCERMRDTKAARAKDIFGGREERDEESEIAVAKIDICGVIEQDVDVLNTFFMHSLSLKADVKPKRKDFESKLEDVYVTSLMPVLKRYYRHLHAERITNFRKILHEKRSNNEANTDYSPTIIHNAALTLKSLNDALSPSVMLDILVSTCKAIGCQRSETSDGRLTTDDLLGVLSETIMDANSPDIIVWSVIMEEFIDSVSAVGEAGFCLASLHAAIQYVLGE